MNYKARSETILADLDLLRDRRAAKTVSEDDYRLEHDRLWDLLRKADRKEINLKKQRERQAEEDARQRLPKVYCDGCCEPGQSLGIGVFSSDLGIEISLEVDQTGTCNVAECLGAITALEECKKRGISGIRLLSDSQLVVNWANGSYATKSSTARKYVPKIRQLLAETKATIEWIPGKTNLADKYSRGTHKLPDSATPFEKIKLTPTERLTFKQLAALKSGRDELSRTKAANVIKSLPREEWEVIAAKLDKEKYQLSAARWRLRGLPLATAIRKVQVDREIGHNVVAGRSRW